MYYQHSGLFLYGGNFRIEEPKIAANFSGTIGSMSLC